MNEPKWYFSLKTKGGNTFHPAGKVLKFDDSTVDIGEGVDCDVRYPSDGPTIGYYATIIRNPNGQSWRIVKRSVQVPISIDGKGDIGYACQLHEGDVIRFGESGMTLRFKIHHDNRFNQDERSVAGWLGFAAVCAGFALFAVFAWLYSGKDTDITEEEAAAFEASVYRIRVDSVQFIQQTSDTTELLMPTKVLNDEAPTGTAFLTTDSMLVTARHCIEYWLGTNLNLTADVSKLPEDDIVRWAIEAESFNQARSDADTLRRLCVYFTVYDCLGEKKYTFASTDANVHINTAQDGIFLLGDFEKDYYWRSIRPYFSDIKMALGDILWIDGLDEAGQIELAKKTDIAAIKRGRSLMVCGYPVTGIGNRRISFARGHANQDMPADVKENIFFTSDINHGFSGGPVLCHTSNGIACVGIVSRVDSVSNGVYKWAVPVSEICPQNKK